MIRDTDTLKFHEPATREARDGSWAETNAFDLYIAEEGLGISVYTIYRPFINNALSNITVWKGTCSNPVDVLYNDFQVHVPIPEGQQLGDCRLPNGLHTRSVNAPMDYEVTYEGLDGTRIAFYFEGLMSPQDITDPEMDPITAKKQSAAKEGVDADAAFTGHYEQTGDFKGELRLRGKTYRIDCVSTIDHSWGPRPETHCPEFAWGHAHFGRDLALHWIFAADPLNSSSYGPLAHGYVMEKGEVFGLVSGSGEMQRAARHQKSAVLRLEDVRGKGYELESCALNSTTWNPWPMIWGYYSLHEWRLAGETGYGSNIEFGSIRYWSAKNAI